MALNKVSRTLLSLLWKLQESFEQFIHIKKTAKSQQMKRIQCSFVGMWNRYYLSKVGEVGDRGIFLSRMKINWVIQTFRFGVENEYQIWFKVFSCIVKTIYTPEVFIVPLFTRKVSTVIVLKEVKTSPDSKMLKLRTFDNSFPTQRHSR